MSMNTYYQQFDESGRMFLDSVEPKKPELLIKAVQADTWTDARDKIAVDEYDPRFVKGFVYKQGWGYFK